MSTTKRIAVAAGIVAAGLTGLGAVAVVANTSFDHHRTETYSVPDAVSQLRVSSGAGDVHVIATDAGRVTVRETARWVTDEPSARHGVAAGVLRLDAGCSGSLHVLLRCQTDYRIEVPRDIAVDIRVDSG